VLLVWKLDRFGRSVLNLVEGLNKLASYGVRFIATSQAIDTDQANPTSKLILWILAAVADNAERAIMQSHWIGMAV
jgi:DNA invertase Pin-like site-specific DNA recombinase